ncbi:MAG: polyamine aminopropyltransferase [Desulfurobacteriaceae bacterium]
MARSLALWLSLSIFMTGASGLIYEYLLSTTSSYIMGSSIEQFSITIALMLLFMGLAGYYQKNISDRNLIEKFIVVESVLSLVGGLSVVITYFSFAYLENYELIYYLTASFIGFLIGLEIPIVLRINEKYIKKLSENISFIYSADYVGAFVGALVWVYIILRHFSLVQAGFITSAANLLVAVITLFVFERKKGIQYKKVIYLLVALVFLIDIAGFTLSRKIEKFLQRPLYNQPVIFHERTKYQDIAITRNKKTGEIRLYINGNLQFSSADEKIYHELLVHPAMNLAGNRKNVLVLGGGDGLVAREILKYSNVNITLVDLDREMIEIAKREPLVEINRGSFLNDRVKVINTDADVFLVELLKRGIREKYDVVIVDLPDPSTVELAKLYSVEFYRKLFYLLRSDGIMAVQSTSPYFAPDAFTCIEKTIEKAGFNILPYHYDVPSFGDWGFVIAYKFSKEELDKKIKEVNFNTVNLEVLTKEMFLASLVFPKGWIKTKKKEIEVNSIFSPVIVHYYNDNAWETY